MKTAPVLVMMASCGIGEFIIGNYELVLPQKMEEARPEEVRRETVDTSVDN